MRFMYLWDWWSENSGIGAVGMFLQNRVRCYMSQKPRMKLFRHFSIINFLNKFCVKGEAEELRLLGNREQGKPRCCRRLRRGYWITRLMCRFGFLWRTCNKGRHLKTTYFRFGWNEHCLISASFHQKLCRLCWKSQKHCRMLWRMSSVMEKCGCCWTQLMRWWLSPGML